MVSSFKASFGFKIDFVRDTEDPSRVFRAFSKLIEFAQVTDQTLIKSLNIEIQSTLLLDNIEKGSITVWLKTIFVSLKTDSKKFNLQLINSYLIESKSCIISFLNRYSTINSNSEILELQNQLASLASKTNTNELNIYTPPNSKELLERIDQFQLASSELQAADKLYYLTSNSELFVERSFSLSPESKEDLLVKETLKNELIMILKVKKPDYIGKSKWEFIHNRKLIEVKISDLEWLQQFRQKEVTIAPGDAIKAKVEIITKYNYQGQAISTQYTIQKVVEVISIPVPNQLSLFTDTS